jgi:predicted N-acetyltransferase YhbS
MWFLRARLSGLETSEPTLSDASEWTIRSERPEDAPLVDALNQAAFGPGRFAKSAYRLREGVSQVGELSFVAVEDGKLRGSVRFWPVVIGERRALMLGPLAVESDQRGRGIGVALMARGIEEARAKGHATVILIGDEPYYARVGFSKLPAGRIRFPGPVDPSRILGLALKPDGISALSGDVRRAHIDDPVCADGAGLG